MESELIRAMESKLQVKMDLLDLPNELLVKIMSYLADHEVKYMGRFRVKVHPTYLRLVCKKFNQIISDLKVISGFASDSCASSTETIAQALASLKDLGFKRIGYIFLTPDREGSDWSKMFGMLRSFQGLHSLYLQDIIDDTTEPDSIEALGNEMASTLGGFRDLKTLSYRCTFISFNPMSPLLEHHTNALKNMARQLESNPRLTRIDIISPCAAVILPAILEHAPSTLTNLLAHNLVCMTESLPTRSIGNVGALLHQKFANLEQLTLPCLPGIWQHLIQMPQLRRLQFLGNGVRAIEDEEVEMAGFRYANLLKLVSLNLMDKDSDISSPGYLKLFRHCPKLDHLGFAFDPDRSCDLQVQIKDMRGLLTTLANFCPEITDLNLQGELRFKDQDQDLPKLTKLTTLSLDDTSSSDQQKLQTARTIFMACPNLEHLNWDRDPMLDLKKILPKLKDDSDSDTDDSE